MTPEARIRSRVLRTITTLLLAAFAFAGCFDDTDGENPRRPRASADASAPTATTDGGAAADEVLGASAGGTTHEISKDWVVVDVPYGDNVKMLGYEQMRWEMERATTIPFPHTSARQLLFGGADFDQTFQEDRTPSPTKIVTWRKLAFEACGAMITKETEAPALFTAVAPTAAISKDDANAASQVKLVFTRFFLDEPTAAEVDASFGALVDTTAAGATPAEAWTGLCVGYLSSLHFLTY